MLLTFTDLFSVIFCVCIESWEQMVMAGPSLPLPQVLLLQVLFIDRFCKVVSKKRAKGICGGVLIGMYSKPRKAGLARVMLRMDLKVLEMTPVLKSSTGSLHILKLFDFL